MSKEKLKILAVDDVKDMRNLLCAIIEKCGYEAFETDTVNGMLSRLAVDRSKIGLILLDINLGDSDGIDAVQKIKNQFGEDHPPICFISGEKDKATVTRAIKAGGCDYVVKPVDPIALSLKIKKLLEEDIEDPFIRIEADIELKFENFPVAISARITEIGETGFSMFTSLPFNEKARVEVDIPLISKTVGKKTTIICLVKKSTEIDQNYTIDCEFSGAPSTVVDAIRKHVIKGVKIVDE